MIHHFGTFEFDDRSLELRRQGRRVPLEPQPARALAVLVARAGEIVTRDELRLAIWGTETHVDFDRGLAYGLSAIRQALGDRGDNPRFVETLPRRGYRFVAPVTHAAGEVMTTGSEGSEEAPAPALVVPMSSGVVGASVSARRWRLPVALAAFVVVGGVVASMPWGERAGESPRAVIAVSVFDNETGDARFDALVSRLSDAVVVRLANLDPGRMAVIGNAEVLRRPRNIRNLQAVAEAVRADYIVLGQLQPDASGWRFVTHLVSLPAQTHLKANRLQVAAGDADGLEAAVLAEVETAVRRHVIDR